MELPALTSPKSHGLQQIAAFLLVVAENTPVDLLPENINVNMMHNGATLEMEWENGYIVVIFDNNKVCEASVKIEANVQIIGSESLDGEVRNSGIYQISQLVYYELEPTEKYVG